MNIAFYSAATGMIAQQGGMNVTANNIANVNTVGYKALRPSFADCIYTEQRATEPEWDTGHGQYLNKTDFLWDIGGFTGSDQPLDYALPNDGFFMVRDYNGRDYLTRDGAFQITNVGDHWELVNANGDFVLDYDGNHITVPFVTEENNEGEETLTTNINYGELTESIGVFTVPNNWGLAQDDSNHFLVTERSGEAVPDRDADKLEFYLERSSVDLAQEMVNMIVSQRSYQLNAKIVQTADEMQQIANNLR
ncbi:MAG: flagellar hook-basal body protein [Bacteroides sp.]|nr:flagellar hook-basal body protein [Bacteroides sp.]